MKEDKDQMRHRPMAVEIDSDLAQILALLSKMTSSVVSSEVYLHKVCQSISKFTKSRAVISWLALDRGQDTVFVLGGYFGDLSEKLLPFLDPKKPDSLVREIWHEKESLTGRIDLDGRQVTYISSSMMHAAKVHGLMVAIYETEPPSLEDHLTGLQNIADASGAFIHNANLLGDLESLYHDLDYMIKEWIRDVSVRLRKVQKSELLLSKILSDLSHEFRTPIASLHLYSGLISKKPDKGEKYLETIKLELARLEQILEGILALSEFHINSSKQQLSLIDSTEFFKRYSDSIKTLLAEFEADIVIDCCAEISYKFFGDESYLFQALSQLILNGAKYGDGSDISVRFRTQSDSRYNQPMFVIEVADEGPGISSNDAAHIFSPFYRGEGVAQSAIFGAGLGLTYAREIVQSFGGDIKLENVGGPGTCMQIWLPLVE